MRGGLSRGSALPVAFSPWTLGEGREIIQSPPRSARATASHCQTHDGDEVSDAGIGASFTVTPTVAGRLPHPPGRAGVSPAAGEIAGGSLPLRPRRPDHLLQ